MTETTPPPANPTPSVIPQKRALNLEDEQHVPAVSSPLNPDSAASKARRLPPREQREKKESLKKREAKVGDSARAGTPEVQTHSKKSKKNTSKVPILSPIRYKLPAPRSTDFDPPNPPTFTPALERAGQQFYECSEHVFNRKGFRYIHCICDPDFPSSQYHRQSETEPYGPRFNFEDASNHVLFDLPGRNITTEKGFRMARANVGAREGRWYWECKILSGVKRPDSANAGSVGGGHVRLGWARREASLDTPVGFDAYSYGLRDVTGQKVHMSRPKDFVNPPSDFCEGDVIGMEIILPSLSLHRKVVDGSYNKAVDVSDDVDPPHPAQAPDIIRDHVPIRYKNQIYFEAFEYHPTKELEDLMNPVPAMNAATSGAAGNAGLSAAPSPNHPVPALRTLPFSSIKVYKNGQYVGEPFAQLLSFLPPASKPLSQHGSRDGLDDGSLGYFPAISVFRGGAAEVNFGPGFWFPPPGLPSQMEKERDGDIDMVGSDHPAEPETPASGFSAALRPMSSRFEEQIAEETVYDIVDEVDFWAQDTSYGEKEISEVLQNAGLSEKVSGALMGPIDPEAPDVRAVVQEVVDSGRIMGSGGEGVIKEVVQEDE